MKKFLDLISEEMQSAFEAAGYQADLGKVTLSNRPDLCEYQCNGAMAGARQDRKAPGSGCRFFNSVIIRPICRPQSPI